jgi:hypothetical protein
VREKLFAANPDRYEMEEEEGRRPLGYLTRKLDEDIKDFQKKEGLRVDGKVKPKGETETALDKLLRKKKMASEGQKQTKEKSRRDKLLSGEKVDFKFKEEDKYNFYIKPVWRIHKHNEVLENEKLIKKVSKKKNIDEDLIKAVMYLETSQGYYDKIFDKFPLANLKKAHPALKEIINNFHKSIRPMNVNVKYWKDLGYTRNDLEGEKENIEAGAKILSYIIKNLDDKEVGKVGTLYQNINANEISPYGYRLRKVYEEKPWKVKK